MEGRIIKKVGAIFLAVLTVIGLSGCKEKKEEGTGMLHYIHSEDEEFPYIGDVHPYYNEKDGKWYLYYLDTSGGFNSKLLVSKDGINWEKQDIKIRSSFANYGVLGIVESEGKYYSYYGDYWASVSEDLINWKYAGDAYKIPQDLEEFPGGNRDPFVAYDEATDRYYSISINYTRRIPSENVYEANLAIGVSKENNLKSFSNDHKKVFANDLSNHDPECPQLIKIGNRWYVTYSLYGESKHGVGRMYYLMGDENLAPNQVDWTSKKPIALGGEDLCAAQIAKGPNNKYYAFGWIPKQVFGGFWGGHINLPMEVYQESDGTLKTRFSEETKKLIKGDSISTGDSIDVKTSKQELTSLKDGRGYLEVDFTLDKAKEIKVSLDEKQVEISLIVSEKESKLVIRSQYQETASLIVNNADLKPNNKLEIIFEEDILEVSLNDSYVLQSRVGLKFGNDLIKVCSVGGEAKINNYNLYHLNYLSEIV